jgi:hypothetical protein
MGTLRSETDHSGMVVNNVLLGVPVVVDGWFEWDDSGFPDGVVDSSGVLL